MPEPLATTDRAAITQIVAALEAAWNAGDGVAFGAPMSDDADFVTIRAEHYRGRQAISAGHAAIFRSGFAGSRIQFTVESARLLRDEVALVHVKSSVEVPAGPLAGHHEALFSAVLTREPNGWCIASFHNTQAPDRAPK